MVQKKLLALFMAFALFVSTWQGALPVSAVTPSEEQSPSDVVYHNGTDTAAPMEVQTEEVQPALFSMQPRAGEHAGHPVCCANGESCSGHEGMDGTHNEVTDWKEFPSDGTPPTEGGNYYLNGDIILNATWEVPDGTVLCLNGHTLSGADGVSDIIKIKGNGTTFTLCDCRDTGKVSAKVCAISFDAASSKEDDPGAAFYMYGGTLTTTGEEATGVRFYMETYRQDTFNMYGGTIENMHTGVYLYKQSTFNMYGGKISNSQGSVDKLNEGSVGTVQLPKNAGVILCGSSDTETTFNMYGGQIIGGTSNGVCVYNTYSNGGPSTFNMYGGEISGNEGAGVIIRSQSKSVENPVMINLYGGTITGNRSSGIDIAQENRAIYIYGKNDISVTGNTLRDKNCNVYKKHTGDMINYFPIRFGSGAKNSTAKIEIGFTYQYNLNESLTPTFPVTIAAPEPSDDFDYLDWFKSDEPGKYYFEKDIQRTRMVLVETPHNHEGEEGEYQIFSTGTLPTKSGKYYLVEDDAMNSGGRATWSVPTGGETILCLNGHTLQSNSRDNAAPVISVPDGATLTLCDCSAGETGKIQSNMSKKPNYLVKVEKGGKFNLNSGKIEGTSSQCNVGVYGTFCMTGGKIIGDKDDTTNETGVYVGNDGKFEMTNGNIMDAHKGVDTVNGSTIELTGGEISGNSNCGVNIGAGTTAALAGIHIINNSFKYPSDNRVYHGAGVHLAPNTGDKKTSLTIGAGTVIKDNMVKNEYGTGHPCNFYYSKGCTVINLAEELTSDTEIRIYYGDPEYGALGDLNRVDAIAENAKKEYLRYFFSDVPSAYRVYHGGSTKLFLDGIPEPPVVILQPQTPDDSESPVGKELTVDAITGTGEVIYQWVYYDRTSGPMDGYTKVPEANGGNTKTCTIPDLEPGEYWFRCIITNHNGGEVRPEDVWDVKFKIPETTGKLEITNDPQEPAVNPGESPVGKEISITATGDEPLSYQWKYNTTEEGYENGQDVTPDGTGASCKIPELAAGEYWFWCEVKSGDSEPVRSNKVKITIPEAETPGGKPTIGTQPTAPDIPDGESPVGKDLSVEASSPEEKELHYQWYYNKQNNTTDGTPTGGDSPSCKIPDLPAGTYYFYCVITDSDGGKVTTNTVKIVIPGDGSEVELTSGETVTTNDGKTEIGRDKDGGTVTIDKDNTDGGGTDTTITLPDDKKDSDVTVDKETGDVTVPGGSTVKGGDGSDGSDGRPDVTIGEPGGTVTKDGEVKIPEGGTANVGGQPGGNGGADVTGGEGGTTITPNGDGSADISEGGKVTIDPEDGQGGTEITLPDGGSLKPDGGVDLPEGGKAVVDNGEDKPKTEITAGENGGSIKPNEEGGLDVSGGTSVKTGENGPEITVGDNDGQGGTVTKDGEVKLPGGGTAEIGGSNEDGGKTTITVPEGGGTVKPDGSGSVEVSEDSKVKTEPGGGTGGEGKDGAEITLPEGGKIDENGGITPGTDENGKQIAGVDTDGDGKPDTLIVLPGTGGEKIEPNENGGLDVPGGTELSSGENDGSKVVVGDKGGSVNNEGGLDLPKDGTVTIENGETGGKTEITAGENGGSVKPNNEGGLDVSGGTSVKTGENGPEITVGDNDGQGGTVTKDGEVKLPGGGTAEIGGSNEDGGKTTITVPEGGGTVKPDGSGSVEVSEDSKVKTEPGGEGKDGTEITLPEGGKIDGTGAVTPGTDENGKQIAGIDTDNDGKPDTLIVLPGTGGGTGGDKIKPNENGGVDVPGGTELSSDENGGSKVVVGDKGGSVNNEGGLDLPKDGTATIENGETGGKTEITAGENGGSVKPREDGGTEVSGSGTKVQVDGGDNKKPPITVDDKGGVVKPDGSLEIKDGASVSIGGTGGTTTITSPGGAEGQTTVTPKDDGTVDVTPGTKVQTTPGDGSGQETKGPVITVGDKGGNVSGGGEVKLPEGGTASVDNGQDKPKTDITAGKDGGTLKPNDKGGLDISGGSTVEIRDGGSENTHPTIITAPENGKVTADKDGSVQIPAGTTVTKESTDGKKTTVTVDEVYKVDANGDPVTDAGGNPVIDENGTVITDEDGTLSFPSGGKVTVEKGDKEAVVEIPAGGSISADSTGTSDVSGTVYVGAGDAQPAGGVKIILQQGKTIYMTTTSSGNGGFLLLNVRKGFYNIVASQSEKTDTRLFNSDGTEKPDYELHLPSDNVSSVLDIDEKDAPEKPGSANVSQTVVGGLNVEAELVKQDENADAVKVTMKVAAKAAEHADNAAAIQNVAGGRTLEYLAITVVKEITRSGSSSESNISQTKTVFEIVIPFNFAGKKNVTVYRHHDGRASALSEVGAWIENLSNGDDGKFWADTATNTIHIYTNKFSTYAIGYSDENGGDTPVNPPVDPKPDDKPTPPSGGSGGGSSSGGSGGGSNVSIDSKAVGGKVTVSPTRPSAGQTVTINVNPDNGYKLDRLTVTDKDGKNVELTRINDDRFTFVMPAGKVKVTPSFVKADADQTNDTLTTFSDVPENAWYAEYVQYVAEHNLMQGYADGRFGPNDSTTRAQIVTILYRAEGEPAVERMSSFADVADTQYYAKAVAWAAANGIVKGYSDTQFGPEDKITREQLAAILYRYAEFKGYAVDANADLSVYADNSRISEYARSAMRWAVGDGLMQGKDNSLLDPTGTATRAEVAAMLMRFLNK